MRRRGILASAVALVTAVVLSACAGMPMAGPVTVGKTTADLDDSLDISFRPAGPQKGATPQQIVEGFIAAGTSPAGNWAIAQQFLSPDFRDKWNPNAGVTIDDLVDRRATVSSDTSITLSVEAVAKVDDTGAYSDTDAGKVDLPFALAKQADGQWRITDATDGIVLDRDLFAQVYHSSSLMWFDPSWRYLVPDVRWFPARINTAWRIVQALMDGAPSTWLAGAVVSAFPDDVTAPDSVPLTADRVAQVEVPPATLGLPQTQLDRMQAQLEASLASAGIPGALMTVGAVEVDATATPTTSTRVDPRPAVLTKDGFGFLTGSELQPIAGLSRAVAKLSPSAVELSPQHDFAALRIAAGVARVNSDESFATLDSRAGLIDPTADGFGYTWSVPATHPSALVAHAADGTAVDVADAWGGASRIVAMQLSRDGTRLVALVDAGGRSEAWIAAVVRDGKAPVRLGQPTRLAALPGQGIDVAWLDDATVGVLAASGGGVGYLTQPVGGPGATTSAPDGTTTVSGGNQLTAVRLLAGDGTMYLKTGTRWQATATGVLVLAAQQGSPQ